MPMTTGGVLSPCTLTGSGPGSDYPSFLRGHVFTCGMYIALANMQCHGLRSRYARAIREDSGIG